MTEGSILKKMMLFAGPVIIGNLLQELYYIFDTLIVGKTLGSIKLAAVGSTSSLTFLMTGFIIGITSGCAVLTSQYFGAGKNIMLKKSVFAHIVIGFATAFALTAISLLCVEPFLTLLNTTDDTFIYASAYLTAIYAGLPATMLYNMGASVLRAVGNSRVPLLLLIFSSVLNIVLDLLFIIVFRWDVTGAAVATVLSQAVSALLCIIYIKCKARFILPDKESICETKKIIIEELKTGIPMGCQYSVISVGMMVLQYFVNGFGSAAAAAFTIGNRIQLFIQNPLNSMSIVMATFTGQNSGAGKYGRIKSGTNAGLALCFTYSVLAGIFAYISAGWLADMFLENSGNDVYNYAVDFIRFNCAFEWSLGMLFIYRGVIQGLKDGLIPMVGSVLEVMMRALSPMLLSHALGFRSICMAGPAAWSASAVLMMATYYYRMKKSNNKNRTAALTDINP